MACAEQCSIGPKINIELHHRQLIFLPLEPRLCGVHGALFSIFLFVYKGFIMDQSTCESERLMPIVAAIKEQLIQAPNGVERWSISEWLTVSETILALRVHARYLDGLVVSPSMSIQSCIVLNFLIIKARKAFK